MKRNDGEDRMQRAVAVFLDVCGLVWCHVPNGGARHPVVAAKLRAAGVKSGVPDILVFDRTITGDVGLAIELKTESGRVSGAQRAWLSALQSRGWRTAVCRSVDDVVRVVQASFPRGGGDVW